MPKDTLRDYFEYIGRGVYENHCLKCGATVYNRVIHVNWHVDNKI